MTTSREISKQINMMIHLMEDENQAYGSRNKYWVVGEEWGDARLNK